MSQCALCDHEAVARIDAALAAGHPLRVVAGQFAVSRSTLQRHAGHTARRPPPLAPGDPVEEAAAVEGDTAPVPAVAAATASPRPTTRVKNCVCCMLPDDVFARLEAALGVSEPSQSLAETFGVGRSAISYHRDHRQMEALSRERFAREAARDAQAAATAEAIPPASPAALPWEELMHLAVQLHHQIEYGASLQALVFSMRNVGKLLPQVIAAMAQACGQPCLVPPGLLLPRFRPGIDLPPHDDWQMRGRNEASSL